MNAQEQYDIENEILDDLPIADHIEWSHCPQNIFSKGEDQEVEAKSDDASET